MRPHGRYRRRPWPRGPARLGRTSRWASWMRRWPTASVRRGTHFRMQSTSDASRCRPELPANRNPPPAWVVPPNWRHTHWGVWGVRALRVRTPISTWKRELSNQLRAPCERFAGTPCGTRRHRRSPALKPCGPPRPGSVTRVTSHFCSAIESRSATLRVESWVELPFAFDRKSPRAAMGGLSGSTCSPRPI